MSRAGKSKPLEAFGSYLKAIIPEANITRAGLILPEFEELTEYHALNDYVMSRPVEGTPDFVLVDEVRMYADLERTISSLHASNRHDTHTPPAAALAKTTRQKGVVRKSDAKRAGNGTRQIGAFGHDPLAQSDVQQYATDFDAATTTDPAAYAEAFASTHTNTAGRARCPGGSRDEAHVRWACLRST